MSVDHFVFHEKVYNSMRSLLIDAAYGSNIEKMKKELKVCLFVISRAHENHQLFHYYMFALYVVE